VLYVVGEDGGNLNTIFPLRFRDRTLLCIAHRLRTILNYDRIMVLEAGQIAVSPNFVRPICILINRIQEFAPPIDLFLKEDGIFHGMCMKSNITRDDIEKGGRLL
jgi:ATP-binding cassette subfamily C (CFTR/MRP) protein 1